MDPLNPEDLQLIEESFQQALIGTDQACSAGIPDIQAHQGKIEEAIGGLESSITYYSRLVDHYKGFRDEQKDKKRKLERCYEQTKRAYWDLRSAEKRAPTV